MHIIRNIALAASAIVVSAGLAAPAQAHKVVHVEGSLYVIICEPGGEAYTFNGSATGAGEVGGYLCPPAPTQLGGGAAGTGAASDFQVIEAKPARLSINTKGTGAKREAAGGATVKECPKGTHWYEPAKACVANGGHPTP